MTTRNFNFVNPPNPLLSIYLFVMIVLTSWNSAISKDNDSLPQLPPVHELELSIKTYHNKRFTAEIQELEIKDKGRILKYIPTVGFTFGLPSISWGTEKIANAKQQKAIVQAKRKSLEFDNQLNMNDEIAKMKIKYENITYLLSDISEENELLKTEKELFEIYQKQYDNKELLPSEYLQKKKTYLTVIQAYRNKKNEIRKMISELLLFSHFGLENKEIYFTIEDCDMLEMREQAKKN